MVHDFKAELKAVKLIYEELAKFPVHQGDRILRHVNEALARDRRKVVRLPVAADKEDRG